MPQKKFKEEEEEKEKSERRDTNLNGLPICPVSGDSERGCNRTACINRAKVKHPDYIISTPRPSCIVTRELPGRSRSDMMYDKVPKLPDKSLPRCPQPFPPIPPKRDPYEEQQRRARLAEYRQRLKRYEE
ncbi:hypothetical protein PYW08_010593 [Mythimna loreyi]|uniref:Uncharacterized protein n=1 Tax=Mythimna loreyi TaxID=667449 RepID=A0ACC2Q4Q1_9NEOP|nr:hypothetical protein PYW08_010593 [Mythimna loreyi]